MQRVLISDNLAAAGLEVLKRAGGIETVIETGLSADQLASTLHDFDGIVIRSGTQLTPDVLKGQKRLRAIVRAGVGVDNIDLPAATREGIVVMNTPAGNTTSTAEHTIALLMGLARNVAPAAHSLQSGRWDRKLYTGTQVAGKSLGVIGLGRIGLTVARRAIGLEMRVVGYDPFLSVERAAEQGIELSRDLDEVVANCDFLTVHTPLTEETRGLIDARRLQLARPGVRVINCARGGIVDEDALADALESGHVGGAALDVFSTEPPGEHRLLKFKNVLATPHLGASTDEAQELVSVEAAEIMTSYLSTGEVRHAVNMAPISAAEMEDVRTLLDLAYRLGLFLSQVNKGQGLRSAELQYRGEAAGKNTRMLTASFAAGLLGSAFSDTVNIVNAELLARERGISITESSTADVGDFATLITASIDSDDGPISASGTVFGKQFLRLVRFGDFSLDAFLDGVLLLYRHRDAPGLIGCIGSVFGKHGINIADMALGRHERGGDAVAVFNLDNEPSSEALDEVLSHPDVNELQVVHLPPAGAPLPWFVVGNPGE